jgi:IS1 family transposase
MKLIACLIILSLIVAFWSTGLASPGASTKPEGHADCFSPTVPEQPFDRLRATLQRDHSLLPPGWGWDMWVKRVSPSCRRRRRKVRRWHKHEPGRLERLLRGFRRWCRRWRCLWRQWRELLDGTVQTKATWTGTVRALDQSTVCAEEKWAAPVSGEAGAQLLATPPPAAEAVDEVSPTTRRGPGRPRSIPTAHQCCPSEGCLAYGRFGDDPIHDIVGCGPYTTVHGEVRQMYKCNVCGQPFSETAGTPFFGLKTPMKTVCIALQEVAEGLGIRAVARIHGVKPDVVLEWLKKAGQHCQALSECMMRELNVTQVQLDELWTFVYKKERMLKEWEKLHSEWGDTWVWVAFDPVRKLVIAVLVGERSEEEAIGFVARLRARLTDACHPLLTSDSLPHYVRAILQAFGVWVQPRRKGKRGRFPNLRQVPPQELNYATVHKERKKGRVVSVTTKVIYGSKDKIEALLEPLGQKINTSFVERVNLTMRHLVSRLHRKTLCFSKKREYLVYHLHLALAYYHFARHHASLRVKLPEPIPTRGDGSPKKWQQRTPAMAAGLTDHRWSLRELLMCPVPG